MREGGRNREGGERERVRGDGGRGREKGWRERVIEGKGEGEGDKGRG